jgi:hypothetical protein
MIEEPIRQGRKKLTASGNDTAEVELIISGAVPTMPIGKDAMEGS